MSSMHVYNTFDSFIENPLSILQYTSTITAEDIHVLVHLHLFFYSKKATLLKAEIGCYFLIGI